MPPILEIIDTRDPADFQTRVLEGTQGRTFIVDFWAPWCQPCRTLAPLLERAVAPFADKAALVKVNIDENPDLAAAFAIQSIPAVKAFRDGQIIGEFIGALPENAVLKTIAEWIPSRSDEAVAEAETLLADGDDARAEALLRDALQASPSHERARVLLAGIVVGRKEADAAESLVADIGAASREYQAAQNVLARAAFVRACQEGGGRSAFAMRLSADDKDMAARYGLACCMAADGDHEMALEQFLDCVGRDRAWSDGAARKAMIVLFDVLGRDDPVADEYRDRLARILFS